MCVGGSTFNSFPDSSDDADEQVWLIEKIVFQFLPGFQKIILRGAHVSRLQATFNSFPDSSDHLVDHRGGRSGSSFNSFPDSSLAP